MSYLCSKSVYLTQLVQQQEIIARLHSPRLPSLPPPSCLGLSPNFDGELILTDMKATHYAWFPWSVPFLLLSPLPIVVKSLLQLLPSVYF